MNESKAHPAMNLILIALILLGLHLGKDLLIPFVLALVVWYLINSLRLLVNRIKLGQRTLPPWLQTVVSILFILIIFRVIGSLVMSNLREFNKVSPFYNERINEASAQISAYFNVPSVEKLITEFDLTSLMKNIMNSSISFLTAVFIVMFYVIFLLIEQGIFKKKLDLIMTDKFKRLRFFRTLQKVDKSIHSYLTVKALISLIVSITSYVVFLSFGVDFAILWAVLAFLLNFIPFVGAFVAIVFPTLICFLQSADPVLTLAIFLILMSIQLVVGNFIEPKIVGKSLNLSPLVVVISLAFWGALWGIAGMFLCIPITVAIMIVLNQSQQTKWIAIMLSAGNDLDAKN